jgi:hypothetical protein
MLGTAVLETGGNTDVDIKPTIQNGTKKCKNILRANGKYFIKMVSENFSPWDQQLYLFNEH